MPFRKKEYGGQKRALAPLSGNNLTQGLVGYWPLSEGGGRIAGDASRRNGNGTIQTGITWGKGPAGPAIQFDGAHVIDIGLTARPAINLPASMTFSAWVYYTNNGVDQWPGADANAAGSVAQWGLKISSADIINWYFIAGFASPCVAPTALQQNAWHMLTGTRIFTGAGNYTGAIHVDGILIATLGNTGATIDAQQGAALGGPGNYPGQYFTGRMDGAALWNRALSGVEIIALYESRFRELQAQPRRRISSPGAAGGATAITFSGPASGAVNVASTNFSIGVDSTPITGTVIVTPASNKAGTFAPTTVSLTTGSPSATCTFTPTASGAHTISETNNGSLANASNLTYTVAPAVTVTLVASPTDATPQINLSNLLWAFWDQVGPAAINAVPVNKGSTGTTDGSGVFTVALPNSTLTNGQFGSLEIWDAATPTKVGAGRVAVT